MSKTVMKNSPQEYAEMLVEKHGNIKSAIIDVTNTLDALNDLENIELIKYYYRQVLKILKSKLNQ